MERKALDRAVPIGYAALVVLSAIFFPIALAGIAIIGALVVAGWFSFARPMLKARERARERGADGPGDPRWYGE
jgi:hypothetical protein